MSYYHSYTYICEKCGRSAAYEPLPYGDYGNLRHVDDWSSLCYNAIGRQIYPPIYEGRHRLC